MHIPDGFLATGVWAGLDAAAVPVVGYMARRAQSELSESRAPLLGVMGAFVFAAQMINFPVGVGTSGHVVGGALLAVTLGPAAACVVMTAILAVQALVFQDGGLLALGANVMNMAVAGVLVGYLPFHYWGTGARRRAAIFLGGTLSVVVASWLTLAELRFSGVPMNTAVLGVSLGLFFIAGIVEGAITLAVVSALEKMNPTWMRDSQPQPQRLIGALAIAAILIGSFGALLASDLPDGLEKFAEEIGIANRAKALLPTPLAGYEWQSEDAGWLGKIVAGITGLAIMFAGGAWLTRMLRRGNH
jgi:cobalt/nickel transport system permease protein